MEDGLKIWCTLPGDIMEPTCKSQRVRIHCRIQFWHILLTPPSLSLSLSLSFSVSLHLSPTNCPIYHSLPYPPHRSNSLKWKERKGGKEGERGMRRV